MTGAQDSEPIREQPPGPQSVSTVELYIGPARTPLQYDSNVLRSGIKNVNGKEACGRDAGRRFKGIGVVMGVWIGSG